MTPEKKEISTVNRGFATLGMALGVFAHARAAEPEAPAPVAVVAAIPEAALASANLAKAALPAEPLKIIHFQVTSGFGKRINPRDEGPAQSQEDKGLIEIHKGIDFAAPIGAPILLPLGDAKVKFVGEVNGFGRIVDLSYGKDVDGNEVWIRFAHLGRAPRKSEPVSLQEGNSVAQGKPIGFVGKTGWSTGPHVHVGLYVNRGGTDIPINMADFDGARVPSWTNMPTAQMLDVEVKKEKDGMLAYLPAPGEGAPIRVASKVDPDMDKVIGAIRTFEDPPKSDGAPCHSNDGNVGTLCGGINGWWQGVSTGVANDTPQQTQRRYERIYVTYHVQDARSFNEKVGLLNNIVQFGPQPAKEMFNQADHNLLKLVELGSQLYDRRLTENNALFAYRDGWYKRQRGLLKLFGLGRHAKDVELITRADLAKTELALSEAKTAVPRPPHWIIVPKTDNGVDRYGLTASLNDLPSSPITDWRNSRLSFNAKSAASTIVTSAGNLLVQEPVRALAPSDGYRSPLIGTAMAKGRGAEVSARPDSLTTMLGVALLGLAGLLGMARLHRKPATVKKKAAPAAKVAVASNATSARRETVSPLAVQGTTAPGQPVSSAPVAVAPQPATAPKTLPPMETVRTSSPAEMVIKPAMIEAVRAASARAEPSITLSPDLAAKSRLEPTITLSASSALSVSAPESKLAAVKAPASQKTSVVEGLRAKHSPLPNGDGWRADYADKSSMIVKAGHIAVHNVRPEAGKVIGHALHLAEQIQKGNPNVEINYVSGSSMTIDKDRIGVHNVQLHESLVIERALRAAAERYKGNFKIKVTGNTPKARYDMALNVKKTALRLGLAGRVVLTGDDNIAGIMNMTASTTSLELRGQDVKSHRPAAVRNPAPAFRQANVA
jgi:murein DD-endopeptidase MepM/ murein hydrolase activator NlpD